MHKTTNLSEFFLKLSDEDTLSNDYDTTPTASNVVAAKIVTQRVIRDKVATSMEWNVQESKPSKQTSTCACKETIINRRRSKRKHNTK